MLNWLRDYLNRKAAKQVVQRGPRVSTRDRVRQRLQDELKVSGVTASRKKALEDALAELD